MAGLAFQIFVFPIQFELRLSIVIEAPERPAVGVVASSTSWSQALLVGIVIHMALRTGAGRALENTRYMTFFAGCDGVLANQRKPGQVVIEPDALCPAFLAMAAFAACSQSILVNIVRPVTVDTPRAELILLDGAFVTGLALQTLMLPPQRELRVPVVVELDLLPVVRPVTSGTVRTVATLVNIVICMTRAATVLFLLLCKRACMALGAFEFSVAAVELKTRIPVMVKSGLLLPAVWNMALLTLGSEPTAVRVVQAMTVIAIFGCLLVSLTNVALFA